MTMLNDLNNYIHELPVEERYRRRLVVSNSLIIVEPTPPQLIGGMTQVKEHFIGNFFVDWSVWPVPHSMFSKSIAELNNAMQHRADSKGFIRW